MQQLLQQAKRLVRPAPSPRFLHTSALCYNLRPPRASFPAESQPNLQSNEELWEKFMQEAQPPRVQIPRVIKKAERSMSELFDGIIGPNKTTVSPEVAWERRSESERQKIQNLRNDNVAVGIYSGRSFDVKAQNVPSAYSRVMGILSRNAVRKELRLAERHEKPTDKRRRLRRERHRRRFAEMVCSDPSWVITCRRFNW
jgi:Ribosomal protein S21